MEQPRRPTMNSRTVAFVAILLFAPPVPASEAEPERLFKVIKIIDGDTIDVLTGDRVMIRLRINGIDAPERGQPFGNNARRDLSDTIGGKLVRLRGHGLDKYNRAITDIYLPGQTELFINRELVKRGLAWHYKEYSNDARLAADEVKARAAKLGLWSDRRHVAPWDWRKLSKVERDGLR